MSVHFGENVKHELERNAMNMSHNERVQKRIKSLNLGVGLRGTPAIKHKIIPPPKLKFVQVIPLNPQHNYRDLLITIWNSKSKEKA